MTLRELVDLADPGYVAELGHPSLADGLTDAGEIQDRPIFDRLAAFVLDVLESASMRKRADERQISSAVRDLEDAITDLQNVIRALKKEPLDP